VAVICRPSDAGITAQTHCRGLQRFNSVKTCIILVLLLLLLLFSLFLFTLLRLYLEIRDIWRPGAGLAWTRDIMALIRDIPGNPGRVAKPACKRHCPSFSHSNRVLFNVLICSYFMFTAMGVRT